MCNLFGQKQVVLGLVRITPAIANLSTLTSSTGRLHSPNMNGYLPHGLPNRQLNYLGGGLINFHHHGSQNTAANHLLLHHQLHHSAANYPFPLNLIQQDFIFKFAFNNSEYFHLSPHDSSWRSVRRASSVSRGTQGLELSAEYTTPIKGSTTAETNTDEVDFDEVLFSEDELEHEDMDRRGLKRHPDFNRQSPEQKRPRSEERYNEWNKDKSGSGHPKQPSVSGPAFLRAAEYEGISDAIWKFYDGRGQVQDLYVQKMKLRDALYAVMKDVFPYCGLYVVGSSMNGFGSQTSDMDLCLMISHSEIDQKKEATEILGLLYKALRKCTFLKDLTLIRAKVPILKFRDKISDVECDLNINNSVGIRNTHLLSAYSKMDNRLGPLVLYVKHWAKSQNINDASQGTLSSYSLVLMIIHFLQVGCSPPVFPSLQQKYQHKFSSNVDIRLLTLNDKLPSYTSPNTQSVGELFVGFLHYYSEVFRFDEDCASVRMGCRLKRDVVARQNPMRNPPSQWKCVCIEEPFDLSNTARSVYDEYTFKNILRIIRKSFATIRRTGSVDDIISQPL